MTKQQYTIGILLGLVLSVGSYCLVLQNQVNANTEVLDLQKEILSLEERNLELDRLIQEEKDGYMVDENAIKECEESFRKSQENRSKKADGYRAEKKQNEIKKEQKQKELGLMLNR